MTQKHELMERVISIRNHKATRKDGQEADLIIKESHELFMKD